VIAIEDWGKERNKGGLVWESFLKEKAQKTVNIFTVQASYVMNRIIFEICIKTLD